MKREILMAIFWAIIIISLIIFIGFAGYNDLTRIPNGKGQTAGFGIGIAHGFLSVISVGVSLFNKKINIYEVHNTGFGYNIGFVIGVLLWVISSKSFKSNKTGG